MSKKKNGFPNPAIAELCARYANSGMKIIPVPNLGTPQQVRKKLGLSPSDFVICPFLASSPGKSTFIRDLVRETATGLTALDQEYTLQMPLVSGGGNWQGDFPDDSTGLMGQWAYGAAQHGRSLRFVITQNLSGKEGLPFKNGYTLCLTQIDDNTTDVRLGTRTDGLTSVSNLLICFPGGLGTAVELLTVLASLGIHHPYSATKVVIVDTVFQSQDSGSTYNIYESTFQQLRQQVEAGYIRESVAKEINEHVIVYRPDLSFPAAVVAQELIAVCLAVRAGAPQYDPTGNHIPLPENLLARYLSKPLFGNGNISSIFNSLPPPTREWGAHLKNLSGGTFATLGNGSHQP